MQVEALGTHTYIVKDGDGNVIRKQLTIADPVIAASRAARKKGATRVSGTNGARTVRGAAKWGRSRLARRGPRGPK